MKKIHWIILIVVIVVVIVGIKGNLFSNKATANEIVIAAPLSFSGGAAADSENIKKGIDLAVEELAKKGIKVRIAYEDDETNPAKTVSAVQKLYASEKHIDAFVGLTWGFLLDAASKIIIEHETVAFTPANTSEIVNTKSKYILFGTLKNAKQDKPIEQWLRSMKATKTAIIVDNTSWGDSHLEAFKTGVQKAGSKVVLLERIALGAEKDTMPTAFAKARAAGADSILWTGYEDGAGAVLIQKIQQQDSTIKLLAATAIPYKLAKDKTITIRPQDNIYALRPQPSEAFQEKFKARYGVAPGSYADGGYDGVMLLVDGLTKKAPNQSLADYLHSGVTYHGFQTDYTFDSNGDITGGNWIVEKITN